MGIPKNSETRRTNTTFDAFTDRDSNIDFFIKKLQNLQESSYGKCKTNNVVLYTGLAGIGKSFLLDHLCNIVNHKTNTDYKKMKDCI